MTNSISPLIPMFAITGKAEDGQLKKAMQDLYDKGIMQVLIYPRSGCEVEYLSDDWKRVCKTCIEFAEEHGMKIWLNDEYNFPSGDCASRVMQENPATYAKRLVISDNGFEIKQDFRNIVDYLNPEATEIFIRLTHQQYYEWFGEYFGKTVLGFFTDEPGPTYLNYVLEGKFHYYDGMEADYLNAYGRDLRADISTWWADKTKTEFFPLYFKLIGKRFKNSYLLPIMNWCKEHGVTSTGHLLEDDNICEGMSINGDISDTLSALCMPGIDEVYADINSGKTSTALGHLQAVTQKNRSSGMAELFALAPCSYSFAEQKRFIWYAAAYGAVNIFGAVLHLDARGNIEKRDYFNNFSGAVPNAYGLKLLGETAKEAVQYGQKEQVFDVAVRFPAEDAILRYCVNKNADIPKEIYTLLGSVNKHQLQWRFIYGNEETNLPVLSIVNGKFTYNGMEYDTADGAVECIEKKSHCVYELNGSIAKSLSVKRYADGAFSVINMLDEARELIFQTEDKKIQFTVDSSGVVTDKNISDNNYRVHNIDISQTTVTLPYGNVYRPNLFNGSCTFELAEDMTLTFCGREYGKKAVCRLDGAKITFTEPASELTDTFNGLYRTSKPVLICRGQHILTLDGEELPFLPAVIVCGHFEVNENTLKPWNNSGNISKKRIFYKQADVDFKTEFPQSEKKLYLELNDVRKLVRVSVDGEEIGSEICAPYRILIPAKHYGKAVEIRISMFSTQAPLMGELIKINEKTQVRKAQWTHKGKLPSPENCGIDSICVTESEI